jgi:hypothetical protein
MDLGEVVNDFMTTPSFLFKYKLSTCSVRKDTPPEPGGETFVAHFQIVSPPILGGVPKSM